MIYESFINGTYVTAWKIGGSIQVAFISRPSTSKSDLLAVIFLPQNFSKSYVIEYAEKFQRVKIDPLVARQNLPRELRGLMSKHLLQGLGHLPFRETTATADSAWRYEQLLDWGESSAVAVLADHMKVNVGTMRARLAQARVSGLLESPGRGSRKG